MKEPTLNAHGPDQTTLIKPAEIVRDASPPMVVQLGNPAEASTGGFSMNVVWQALLQRLKVAAPLGAVLSVIACAVLNYLTEPKYRSQATLEIRESRPHLAFRPDENGRAFADTQIELLRNPYVLGRANDTERLSSLLPELRDIAGKEDAVRWITQRLKVARISQSNLYEVSFTTRHPESAKAVVDAIVSGIL